MSSAYVDALKMLGRRELSEAQIRQRLARREHDPAAIDEAVARLKDERAIDDARVAGAIARTSTSIKRRGRVRVRLEIERVGISKSLAAKAIDETFGDLDENALLDAALSKRLRGRTRVDDAAGRARLYRYLLSQGFDHDRIMKRLARLKGKDEG